MLSWKSVWNNSLEIPYSVPVRSTDTLKDIYCNLNLTGLLKKINRISHFRRLPNILIFIMYFFQVSVLKKSHSILSQTLLTASRGSVQKENRLRFSGLVITIINNPFMFAFVILKTCTYTLLSIDKVLF